MMTADTAAMTLQMGTFWIMRQVSLPIEQTTPLPPLLHGLALAGHWRGRLGRLLTEQLIAGSVKCVTDDDIADGLGNGLGNKFSDHPARPFPESAFFWGGRYEAAEQFFMALQVVSSVLARPIEQTAAP